MGIYSVEIFASNFRLCTFYIAINAVLLSTFENIADETISVAGLIFPIGCRRIKLHKKSDEVDVQTWTPQFTAHQLTPNT